MKRLVIFDFDGTMVSLDVDYDGLRQALREYFLGHGIDMVFRPLQRTALEAVKSVGTDKVLSDTDRIIDGFEMERINNAKAVDGLHNVVKNLSEQGFRLAILSNNGETVIKEFLNKHGILCYFDFVGTRNNVPEVKPSAKGILMIMERLGFTNSDRVFMVGDSMYDMISAEEAGVNPVCVMGSQHSPEVRDQGKYLVMNSLPEIADYLSSQ